MVYPYELTNILRHKFSSADFPFIPPPFGTFAIALSWWTGEQNGAMTQGFWTVVELKVSNIENTAVFLFFCGVNDIYALPTCIFAYIMHIGNRYIIILFKQISYQISASFQHSACKDGSCGCNDPCFSRMPLLKVAEASQGIPITSEKKKKNMEKRLLN